MNNGCWFGCDLLFEQDVTCGIHDAHVDGFQGRAPGSGSDVTVDFDGKRGGFGAQSGWRLTP
jgi:hypothetical protein